MKKSKAVYFLVFAVIFSVISLICGVNIFLNLIKGQGADEVTAFYSRLSTLILSISALFNSVIGIIMSVILIAKKSFKPYCIITLTICICSVVAVLAGFLI